MSLVNLSIAYERMRYERDEAIATLRESMALANKTTRSFKNERDQIIRKLREEFSCIQIAEKFGLTRQRVHQILNEAPIDGGAQPQSADQPGAEHGSSK